VCGFLCYMLVILVVYKNITSERIKLK